ncbi:MAG: Holliday junction branch migration protein RuvA [Gammaproteobacteria bacterium]|nr:Holliday junction branch migration protein RuvA [Gammaproteobacteria bacterium]
MIYCIQGTVIDIDSPWLTLMTPGGVGYEIECTQLLLQTKQLNDQATIYTQMIVREDAQLLYGFASQEEKEAFRTLIKVSGVGPKMAINLLSSISLSDLILAIQNKTPQILVNCKGVGKKVAEKIVVECQNRFTHLTFPIQQAPQQPSAMRQQQDALAALIALGYRQPQISPQLEKALASGIEDTSEIVRFVLSELQPQ